MPRVYQCIRSHQYIVSVKPKHSIRVYLCPSVAQKTKLRKLTGRQRKQAIWPRMDTDADCRLPRAPPGEDWNKIVWLCFGETLYYGDDTDGWIPSEVPTPSKSTDSVWSRSSTGMHINLILLS